MKIKSKIKNSVIRFLSGLIPDVVTQLDQVMIANQYLIMKKILAPNELPSLNDVGFKVHSQFEEDGLLLYIFSIIGTTNKRVVEICAGDGIQCMAANLILNHAWEGLLFDGDTNLVQRGNEFYASNETTALSPPIIKQAWITRENINQLILDNGFQGEIDLLSLDIDGNDYYVMDAIDVVKPRVIICETHNIIPSDLALTIPYKPDFDRLTDLDLDYMGVSLLGMKQLLNEKGYRLIGSHSYGFNAIFMLTSVGTEYFPEISVENVHNNLYTKFRREASWERVKHFPWIKIDRGVKSQLEKVT